MYKFTFNVRKYTGFRNVLKEHINIQVLRVLVLRYFERYDCTITFCFVGKNTHAACELRTYAPSQCRVIASSRQCIETSLKSIISSGNG